MKASNILILAWAIFIGAFASSAIANPGDLDASFAGDGEQMLDFGSAGNDQARAVAIQPDGKIVVAGEGHGSGQDFAVARLNPDGTPDMSFGQGGLVLTDFGGIEIGMALVLQPDGKIVVAGLHLKPPYYPSDYFFALARYLGDGTLDTSFGDSGRVITKVTAGNDVAFALALQKDGKIIAAGRGTGSSGEDFAMARYMPNGSLDASFGGAGIVLTDFGGENNETAIGVVVQGDGKILLAGGTTAHQTLDFALARYTETGALDGEFGQGGKVVTNIGFFDAAEDVALQPDGKIVVVGRSNDSNRSLDVAIVRYLSSGALDSNFGVGGVVFGDFSGDDAALGVDLSSDGKIIVAGYISNVGLLLARYLNDGKIDANFGNGGGVIAAGGIAWDVALQGDGKIVVSGGKSNDALVARYLGDSIFFDSVKKFGAHPVGGASAAQVLMLKNGGVNSVVISDAKVIGENHEDFRIVDDGCAGVRLDPGFTCNISVEFYPGGEGARYATLEVASDDPAVTAWARLEGVGIVPFSVFDVSSLSIRKGRDAGGDSFDLRASFVPGMGSNGINLSGDQLTLQVGPFSVVLPPGSLSNGSYRSRNLDINIRGARGGSYELRATGRNVNLQGVANPVPVTLQLGYDQGKVEVNATIR